MGKWIILAILFSIIAVAQDNCQYTEVESYISSELALVDEKSLEKKGEPLNISNFVSANEESQFTVHNPNSFELLAQFRYNITGYEKTDDYGNLEISPNSYKTFEKICVDSNGNRGNCSIIPESVSYVVLRPQLLVLKNTYLQKNKTICKKCNGQHCLNDGLPCSSDSQCGYGKCNFAGYCGEFVKCPEGTENCNNQTCLKPKNKTFGEPYLCNWECSSGVVDGNICGKDNWTLIKERITLSSIFVLAIIIAALFLIVLYTKKIHPLQKIKNELTKEITKLLEEKDNIDQNLQFFRKRIQEEKELFELQSESLQNEIEFSKGKAKEQFEREYSELKKKNNERLQLLTEEANQLELLRKEVEMNKKTLENDNYKIRIEKAIDKYKKIYGERIRYENGYLRFTDSGNFLHVYLYTSNGLLHQKGHDIHHIDKDSLNNELWNLISLPKDKHKKLIHGRIEFGNWKSGIKQLKEQLGMKNTDFHEHIIKHMKK